MSNQTWESFMGLFQANDVVSLIVGITIAVLIVILALWLTFEILYLTFWLLAVFFKGLFLGLAILIYTLIVMFLTAPIGLIFQRKSLAFMIHDYAEQLKNMVFIFYPKLQAWVDKNITKSRHSAQVPVIVQATKPVIRRRTIRPVKTVKTQASVAPVKIVSKTPSTISRTEEIDAKTVIVRSAKSTPSNSAKFFCTDCGNEFTAIMDGLLKTKNMTFCQKCGKRFNMDHGLPIPAPKV